MTIRPLSGPRAAARVLIAFLAAVSCVLAACSSGTPAPQTGDQVTIPDQLDQDVTISFWHVYTGGDGKAMNALLRDFEDENPQITVKDQFAGSYQELGKKLVSSLQAGSPPDVTIAYPSDVVKYNESKRLLDLTSYLNDPSVGLSEEQSSDIYDIERLINRYAEADGHYLSFPFTASVMLMYYNEDLLRDAGIEGPPSTWDEFETQCEIIKAELNRACYAANANASTLHGFAGSFGGQVMTPDGKPAYDSPEWTDTLETLSRLSDHGYVRLFGAGEVTTPDQQAFISNEAPFIFTTSRNVPFLSQAIGNTFNWGAAPPPQAADTDTPRTVLYGPGLAAFGSTQDRQLAAWTLIKYLSGSQAQSKWATTTGNVPIRASVADDPKYADHLDDNPAMETAQGLLPGAIWEGAIGDQGVVDVPSPQLRTTLADTMTAVINGSMDPTTTQQQLQKKATSLDSGG